MHRQRISSMIPYATVLIDHERPSFPSLFLVVAVFLSTSKPYLYWTVLQVYPTLQSAKVSFREDADDSLEADASSTSLFSFRDGIGAQIARIRIGRVLFLFWR